MNAHDDAWAQRIIDASCDEGEPEALLGMFDEAPFAESQKLRKRAVSSLASTLDRWGERASLADVLNHPVVLADDEYVAIVLRSLIRQTTDPKELEALLEHDLVRATRALRSNVMHRADATTDVTVVRLLCRFLQEDPDATLRFAAARRLGELGFAAGLTALERGVDDQDTRVRARSIQAIGELGQVTQPEVLMEALNDDDWLVATQAANTLELVGGGPAVPALSRALGHRHRLVRQAAARALAEIGGEDAAVALDRAAENARLWNRAILKQDAEKARAANE